MILIAHGAAAEGQVSGDRPGSTYWWFVGKEGMNKKLDRTISFTVQDLERGLLLGVIQGLALGSIPPCPTGHQ